MSLTVLSNKEISKYNPSCFVIYSDNILESTNVLDTLATKNELIDLVGVSFEPNDQPIYLYSSKDKKINFCIKVAGRYENWDLPDKVKSVISFIDKPDFIIVNAETDKEVFVGETTGTANVGNSQWQREGRKISAAVKKIPMVYQTYYSGTDRSKVSQDLLDSKDGLGQVREASSLQVINHLVYSLRYRCPSFVIYFPNSEYDSKIGFDRDNEGRILFNHYITSCLLCEISDSYKVKRKELELRIYEHMLSYILESVKSRSKTISRIDKDFPVEPMHGILKEKGQEFIKFLVDYINRDKNLDSKYNLVDWKLDSFLPWSHRYKNTPLLKFLSDNSLPMLSYLPTATKVGIAQDTKKLIELLSKFYKSDAKKIQSKLNANLPTLIIPTLMFQKKGNSFIYKVDPGTGELTAFSELFAYSSEDKKQMNILVYVHVPGPEKFSDKTKLFKAFRRYADCLIINDKVYEI
ncbi:MAG: hypothetical protein HUU49_01875 [Candidatus Buchananbacteria bacterium]|nr:hypothetical protein [Candidatus Buchananbacteria bacterium]